MKRGPMFPSLNQLIAKNKRQSNNCFKLALMRDSSVSSKRPNTGRFGEDDGKGKL